MFHFSFFLSCHNSYIHIFMVTSYLHITMHSYAAYKTRLSINIRLIPPVFRAEITTVSFTFPNARIINIFYVTIYQIVMPFTGDARVTSEKHTRMFINYTFATRKIIFNARIADITFLCDTTIRIFGIDMNVGVLVSLFCLFVFKKKRACTKLAVEKILLAYSLRPKNFRNPNGSSTESLSVI